MQLFADISTALALTILTAVAVVMCSHIKQLKYSNIYTYALMLRTSLSVMCVGFWIKVILYIV